MSVKSLPVAILCLASGMFVSTGASAGGFGTSSIDLNFAQTFVVKACPATAPVDDLCLYVTGLTDQPWGSRQEFSRIAVVNPASFDDNHPTCLPIETTGTLTLPRGTLSIHAPGNVCFSDGTASYDVIITGGSGAYAGAMGSGKIVVPPPDSNSTGRELWHLDLVSNHGRRSWPH